MKKPAFLLIPVVLILSISSAAWFFSGDSSAPAEKPHAFNTNFSQVRIENEGKLVVPPEIIEDVWQYMLNRIVTDKSFIQGLDPSLDSYWNDELFTDAYFDTPDLVMLAHESGIRYRFRTNLTDPEDNKNGRELLQVKLNDIDSNVLNRGEIKFDIHYRGKPKNVDDLSPVLGMLKGADQEEFKRVMDQLNVDPYQLRRILVLNQHRRSIYIRRNGEAFISIRLDQVTSEMMWAKYYHVEIEPELNEIPYTAANAEQRAYMQSINMKILEDIQHKFPDIQMDLTPKYNKAFNYFEIQIPRLRFLIKNGLMN